MQIVKTSVCVRISKKNPDENTFVMIEKKYLDYIQIMWFINFVSKISIFTSRIFTRLNNTYLCT